MAADCFLGFKGGGCSKLFNLDPPQAWHIDISPGFSKVQRLHDQSLISASTSKFVSSTCKIWKTKIIKHQKKLFVSFCERLCPSIGQLSRYESFHLNQKWPEKFEGFLPYVLWKPSGKNPSNFLGHYWFKRKLSYLLSRLTDL